MGFSYRTTDGDDIEIVGQGSPADLDDMSHALGLTCWAVQECR